MNREKVLISSLLLVLTILVPTFSLAQAAKVPIVSSINISVLSYHRNMIGLDVFYNDKYVFNKIPGIRYIISGKSFSYRTGVNFFSYHNVIDTRVLGVMDTYRSVDANYFQSDAWFGIEKRHPFGIISASYFIESGPGLVFYSGKYTRSSMPNPFSSSFKLNALYINLRPGVGLDIKIFERMSVIFETSIVVDILLYKSKDDFDLLPRSRLLPQPIGQLGISYTFR